MPPPAADFGKPGAEVDIAEIMIVLSELAHTRKKLKELDEASVRACLDDHARHLIKNYYRAEGHQPGDLALELSV